MLGNTDAELMHMLQSIAVNLEASIRRGLPADGSAEEDFEMWQWCFWKLFDLPADHLEHTKLEDTTAQALRNVLAHSHK